MRANYEDLIGYMMTYFHSVITSRNNEWESYPETIDTFKYEEIIDFEYHEDGITCNVKIGKTNYQLFRDFLTNDTLVKTKRTEYYINDMAFDKQIELFNCFNIQVITPIMEIGKP